MTPGISGTCNQQAAAGRRPERLRPRAARRQAVRRHRQVRQPVEPQLGAASCRRRSVPDSRDPVRPAGLRRAAARSGRTQRRSRARVKVTGGHFVSSGTSSMRSLRGVEAICQTRTRAAIHTTKRVGVRPDRRRAVGRKPRTAIELGSRARQDGPRGTSLVTGAANLGGHHAPSYDVTVHPGPRPTPHRVASETAIRQRDGGARSGEEVHGGARRARRPRHRGAVHVGCRPADHVRRVAEGRAEIVPGTLAASKQNTGTRTITVDSVRFITPDVAIADGPYVIAPPGGAAVRRMWTTIVVVRGTDGWRISAIRNMVPTAAQ